MYQRHTYPAADANAQGGAIFGTGRDIGAIAMAQKQEAQLTREAQVHASSARLSACIEDLESAIGALHARMEPVLRPIEVNKSGADGCAPEPVRCPLAMRIEREADRIGSVTAELRDVLSRLEV